MLRWLFLSHIAECTTISRTLRRSSPCSLTLEFCCRSQNVLQFLVHWRLPLPNFPGDVSVGKHFLDARGTSCPQISDKQAWSLLHVVKCSKLPGTMRSWSASQAPLALSQHSESSEALTRGLLHIANYTEVLRSDWDCFYSFTLCIENYFLSPTSHMDPGRVSEVCRRSQKAPIEKTRKCPPPFTPYDHVIWEAHSF